MKKRVYKKKIIKMARQIKDETFLFRIYISLRDYLEDRGGAAW